MRCSNCGWPNRPDATCCSKCGKPLETETPNVEGGAALKQTVNEGEVFGHEVEAASQPNICPKCSYPLRPGTDKCPNCGTLLSAPKRPTSGEETPRYVRRPTVLSAPKINGTVNVWTEGAIGITPSFILSPVKRSGERHEPEKIELEGEEVQLNRDLIDPGNMSITSKVQAVIRRVDNQWVIEDKSEQKTTFVQVKEPHTLHEGDIILMGNRLFIFHE